ncbi:hypothetical protein Zmor_000627 [Zophobas morio]|uniref:Uncharacterized protein n=1 Tax=Zophobas morio TaxID=2755281 RepID=A0AA38J6F4_9CUCU|nr:hypothetical protein Zmor_000627 [Zophobas morio]
MTNIDKKFVSGVKHFQVCPNKLSQLLKAVSCGCFSFLATSTLQELSATQLLLSQVVKVESDFTEQPVDVLLYSQLLPYEGTARSLNYLRA